MQKTTEVYKLCLDCKCLSCKNETITKEPYSCKIYPKRRKIPPQIWNHKEVECEYFSPKIKAQIIIVLSEKWLEVTLVVNGSMIQKI